MNTERLRRKARRGLKGELHALEVRRVAFALIPIVGWVLLPSANRKIAELRFRLYELERTSGSSE